MGDNACGGCSIKLFDFLWSRCDVKELLISHNVIRNSVLCTKCGHVVLLNWDKKTFDCQKIYQDNKCNFSRSCLVGTFFENTHLSPDIWLTIIIFWLRIPPPDRQSILQQELKISGSVVIDCLTLIRNVAKHWVSENTPMFGGVDQVVEVGFTQLGSKKKKGNWVFGGVLRGDAKKVFVVPVNNRTSKTIVNVLRRFVLPGTTIMTNHWNGFDNLQNEGYVHLSVNIRCHFVDPTTGAHTQNINRMWRDVRDMIRSNVKDSEGYLAEFRFKRAYPDSKQRLHHFLIVISDLFSPPP